MYEGRRALCRIANKNWTKRRLVCGLRKSLERLYSSQPSAKTEMNFIKTVGQSVLGTSIEMPSYEVVQKTEDYEERQYPAKKWASTKVLSMVRKEAVSTGFWRLFKYIQGENVKEMKIDMTAPVTTKVEPGAGPNCESTFTVGFYVPGVHQETTPAPTNKDVYIEEVPAMTVYARTFGGFASDETFIEEARKLSEKIDDKNIIQEYYYTVGYDSPYKLFNRKNEVWFVKSPQGSSQNQSEQ